jgi:hypothetical protein
MEEPTNAYGVRIAVLETQLAAAGDARDLQAREYERRLSDLNHAHQQASERNAEFVPRALHDSLERELRTLIKSVDDSMAARLGRISDRVDALSSKVYMGIGIAVTIQVLLFVIVEVWKR